MNDKHQPLPWLLFLKIKFIWNGYLNVLKNSSIFGKNPLFSPNIPLSWKFHLEALFQFVHFNPTIEIHFHILPPPPWLCYWSTIPILALHYLSLGSSLDSDIFSRAKLSLSATKWRNWRNFTIYPIGIKTMNICTQVIALLHQILRNASSRF